MLDLENFLSAKKINTGLKKIVLAFSKGCVLIEKELNNYEKTNSIEIGKNFSGDIQKPIDIRCNNIILSCLNNLDNIFYLTSEEEDRTVIKYRGPLNPFPENVYSVAFDPLDGSDNVDSNSCVGTIFGIYKEINEKFQHGRNIVCSGYAIYSNPTIFVITFGDEVYEFKLKNNEIFEKTSKNLVIPNIPKKIFSGNVGNISKWGEKEKSFYNWVISEREKYTFRYSGCMVFDIHRILCQGGIFIYPKDNKNINGKLRIYYECIPMSFIVEAANGISTDGEKRLLDNFIFEPHQRTPIFIGCKRDVIAYKYFPDNILKKSNFVIESFNGSGEDELSVDEGELIKEYQILSDKKWSRVTSGSGKIGIVPTKCLYLDTN